MTKDGNILEELIKLNHGYKFSGVKIYSLPTLHFEKVNYTKFMKIKRLTKGLKTNAIARPEGDLDTINLLDHPERYDITLKGAFILLEGAGKRIGCSITFRRQK